MRVAGWPISTRVTNGSKCHQELLKPQNPNPPAGGKGAGAAVAGLLLGGPVGAAAAARRGAPRPQLSCRVRGAGVMTALPAVSAAAVAGDLLNAVSHMEAARAVLGKRDGNGVPARRVMACGGRLSLTEVKKDMKVTRVAQYIALECAATPCAQAKAGGGSGSDDSGSDGDSDGSEDMEEDAAAAAPPQPRRPPPQVQTC